MDTNLGQVVLVEDINPGGSSRTYSDDAIEFQNKLYFTANDGSNRELYVSDGTSEGTKVLADINSGNYGSSPYNFTELNGKLYFVASDGTSGRELYVTDGTSEGTSLAVNLSPDSNRSYFGDITKFNDKLYFAVNSSNDNGSSEETFYVSDGTQEGTQVIEDIDSSFVYFLRSGVFRSFSSDSAEFNGKLYFRSEVSSGNGELYVTDGTAEGTKLVKDINRDSNSGSSPSGFTEFNGKLYFSANNDTSDNELFVTDGTAEGTKLVKDINPGGSSSFPNDFTEFNGKLYFSAFDGSSAGSELYVTDGTAEGTKLVKDINPGGSSSFPSNFTELDGKLYFSADDGRAGRELFVTDGTTEGTLLVRDIDTGSDYRSYTYSKYPSVVTTYSSSLFPNGSNLSNLTAVGNELLFFADDGQVGNELFKLTFDDTNATAPQPLNPLIGTNGNDNIVGTDSDDEISGNGGNDGITGEFGNDVLNGNGGNDVLDGGFGDDTIDGGEGTDTVVYQFASNAVTVTLGEGEADGTTRGTISRTGFDRFIIGNTDSLLRVENVIGSGGNDNLTGNSGSNSLTGRNGNDIISGLGGEDFLTGSQGADSLTGGEGSDQFVYLNPNEGGDTITDFVVGTDKIAAVASGFGGELSAGELSESSFVMGSAATNSEQRFVFNDASSELFFDADGSGAASQQLIATLDGVSNLSTGDILLL